MTVIVTDTGFAPDDWTEGFVALGAANDAEALDVPSDADPNQIPICDGLHMVRIDFPSSADGRGFTIARALRLRGYTGRLRARGHVLADQYAMARRCGFDEVEIDASLAKRQPAEQWQFRANWQAHDYQNRLRGAATG
ncbi:DUF934 domain-containing protein [Roseobacter denitrificans]|uniref:Oxidoreductase n=1 Tax=Roseobacter denitrificans (strain ATCC 33942 / OCh 114) TaxID=375451 RepID=Q164V5_ROSDO|nr:DUF934 domain-containing protein [Roseobacter denitrificans]ABG32488.1 conserved hypothetical protein [Roseobacter denitrificans OCh 114]AVL51945.1 DUF934 domain-containing protein [Roseobacter denitrificans]SFF82477.1 protein of unknown function [Roseobacter denitrificans OCh 114]